MKKSLCILAISLSAISGVHAEENQREQDMKAMFQKTFLAPHMEPYLQMIVSQSVESSDRQIDPSLAMKKLRDLIEKGESLESIYPAYEVFSDEEIHELRRIMEHPIQTKVVENMSKVMQAQTRFIAEQMEKIIGESGEEKIDLPLSSEILEVTQANFEKEVLGSSLPVVLDVYSNLCPPCKIMEPILEDLSREYRGEVRFLKVNCDEQFQLAKKFGITKLPTFLFIKPGQEAPSMQAVGFTSKKVFEEKLSEFLGE